MHPLKFIRTEIFGLSQADFADLAGATQPQVSRWENGESSPDLEQMARIRSAARRRRLSWDDGWFFDVPKSHRVTPQNSAAAP